MQPEDLFLGGGPRLQLDELIHEAADLDQVADPALALGAFDMRERLNGEARGHHPGTRAGVVPRVQLVPEESSGHSSSVVSRGAAGLTSTAGASGSGGREVSDRRGFSGYHPSGADIVHPVRERPKFLV